MSTPAEEKARGARAYRAVMEMENLRIASKEIIVLFSREEARQREEA